MSISVFNDAELRRIIALPRRPQEWDTATTQKAVSLLTKWLKTPNGTMQLLPIQARMLVELHDTGRLAAPMVAPGAGKTLLSALAPTVIGAKRTLLLVPAALREKTYGDFEELSKHWRLPNVMTTTNPRVGEPVLRVMGYESLSSVNQANFIDEFNPDLIIADEAHALQSMKSGRSRRVFRFIKNKRRSGGKVVFIPMTGTGFHTKLGQVAHLLEAALEKGSPLPTEYTTLEQWGRAVDQGVKEQDRYGIGALQLLAPNESKPTIESIRRAIRDRILSTPSVIATKDIACAVPLILKRRDIAVPATVRTAMRQLREDYVLPNGDPCEGGVVFWNHAREIANGFCYQYKVAPPQEWREARSAWVNFCREVMTHSRKQLDTPLQIWNAVEAGQFGTVHEWENWKRIRDTFKPETLPLWIDDYLVRDAEKWALETGGIVWVSHSTAYTYGVDEDEDQLGGQFKNIPYFGAGDERIKTFKGPCAASVRSHGVGKNLQQWDRALIMGFPSSNKTLEQLLARLHRTGQKSEQVQFEFYAHSLENLNAIDKCLDDAKFICDTSGSDQRILNAYILDADDRSFNSSRYRAAQDINDPLWK